MTRTLGVGAIAAITGIATVTAAACGGQIAADDTRRDASTASSSASSGGSSGGFSSTSSASSSASSSGDPDPGGCPENLPVTASDLDKEIGWKLAAPAKGACTESDLSKLESNFEDPNIQSYFDLGNGVSESCRACTLSKDTDAAWAPIVGAAETDGATGFVNHGACFGYLEGDACGKAVQYAEFCRTIACTECATTQTARQQCLQKADVGMCASFVNEQASSCPMAPNTVTSCGSFISAVRTLCGPVDAGS